MKNNRKVCVCSPRDRIAALACLSMRADSMGGESHCDNLLWQSCRTIYFFTLEHIIGEGTLGPASVVTR